MVYGSTSTLSKRKPEGVAFIIFWGRLEDEHLLGVRNLTLLVSSKCTDNSLGSAGYFMHQGTIFPR